jgi:hypothetical protein
MTSYILYTYTHTHCDAHTHTHTQGAKKSLSADDDWSDAKAAWISAIIGLGCAVLGSAVGIPFLKYKLRMRLKAAKELEDAATLQEITTSLDEKARLELLVSSVVIVTWYHAALSAYLT